MRLVFMGTPQLAATVLSRLAESNDVVAVFTRPDAVRGRGNKLIASPVKQEAERLGIPVYTPATLKDEKTIELIRSLKPEAICVSAYGVILPPAVLEIPPHGCLNVHTSLLPRWRGAAPIQRAILADDETTGVCIMRMEEGLDTGDYCKRVEVPIQGAYADELTCTLADAGAQALVEALDEIGRGAVTWVPQGEDGLTYAQKIAKGELALAPEDECEQLVAKVHASSAAHPARASIAGKTLSVEKAASVEDEFGQSACRDMESGQARYAAKRLFIQAADGPVEVLQVKPDGKKSMDARSFAGGIQGIKNMELTWERA